MKTILLATTLLFTFSSFAAPKPSWISDTTKIKQCKKQSLCAVGTGEGLNWAKRDARAAIAKIFSTKISSRFSSNISTGDSRMSEELEESTDAALEGIEIIKVYEGDTDVYALAAIDKEKAAAGFKTEINKLDEKMQVYLTDSDVSTARALEKAFMQREVLNKRYEYLTGQGIAEVIPYEKVFKSKKTLAKVVAHVYLDETQPKEVEGILVKLLTDTGMRVTTGRVRNKNSTHIVTGSLIADKQYMKVAGFEKYKFVLKISASNIKRVETGALNYNVTLVGRNYSQAYDKALPKIKDYLNSNINNLNIE